MTAGRFARRASAPDPFDHVWSHGTAAAWLEAEGIDLDELLDASSCGLGPVAAAAAALTGLAREGVEEDPLITTLDLLAGGAEQDGQALREALDRWRAEWSGVPARRGPPQPRVDDAPIVQIVGALLGAVAWPSPTTWADAPAWLWAALVTPSAPVAAVTWAAEAGPDGLLASYERTSFATDWPQLRGRRLDLLLRSTNPVERAVAVRSSTDLDLDAAAALVADPSPSVHAALLLHPIAAELAEDVVRTLIRSGPAQAAANEGISTPLLFDALRPDAESPDIVVGPLAGREDAPPEWLRSLVDHPSDAVRVALAGNAGAPADVLARLAGDPWFLARHAAASNRSLPDEAAARLVDDEATVVRAALASATTAPNLVALVRRPDEATSVLVAAAVNPDLPIAELRRLADHPLPDVATSAAKMLELRELRSGQGPAGG